MAEQHAVGGRQRQGVTGAFFPGEVFRARHELARLDAGKLGEGSIRRLITPDPLGRRIHRIAAIAFLVVAVVLIAMDHDLVADLPAFDPAADRPDDARGVGAGDMIVGLVNIEGGNRNAQARPDTVVIDARRHHEHQHLVRVDRRRGHDFELHGLFGRAVALAADCPGMHGFRHIAKGRDLAEIIETLLCGGGGRIVRITFRIGRFHHVAAPILPCRDRSFGQAVRQKFVRLWWISRHP